MLTFLEDIPVGGLVNVLWEAIILGFSLHAPTKKHRPFFLLCRAELEGFKFQPKYELRNKQL